MSLYHEAAEFLQSTPSEGGSLKARVFRRKDLKSPPNQLYALVLETCKWSSVLKEVVERAEILRHERKVRPTEPLVFPGLLSPELTGEGS
jgi:putative methyltransferase